MPATTQGREAALKALTERRAKYKDKESIDDSALPAGSPMHYNCKTCNDTIVTPETVRFVPSLCGECKALQELGWLE
jgi:hypothetical protein